MTANIERQVDLSLWLFFEMTVFLSFSYNINVVFNCFYCNVTIIYSILIWTPPQKKTKQTQHQVLNNDDRFIY